MSGLVKIGAHLHHGAHGGLEALLLKPAGQLAVATINVTQVLQMGSEDIPVDTRSPG